MKLGPANLQLVANWVATAEAYQREALNQQVRAALGQLRTESRHLIIIDGVEELLAAGLSISATVASLLNAVARVQEGIGHLGKIILLCRTDLYTRLPNSNKNKYRQDNAIELDWFSRPDEAEKTVLLIALIESKGRGFRDELAEAVVENFPSGFTGVTRQGIICSDERATRPETSLCC